MNKVIIEKNFQNIVSISMYYVESENSVKRKLVLDALLTELTEKHLFVLVFAVQMSTAC